MLRKAKFNRQLHKSDFSNTASTSLLFKLGFTLGMITNCFLTDVEDLTRHHKISIIIFMWKTLPSHFFFYCYLAASIFIHGIQHHLSDTTEALCNLNHLYCPPLQKKRFLFPVFPLITANTLHHF